MMGPRWLPMLAAIVALCAVCSRQCAQQSVPANPAKQPPEIHDIVLEHADRYRYDEKSATVELAGDVVLRHEDGTLRCDKIVFNTKTKQGQASGNPTFADPRHTVSGEVLLIDFKARVAGFRGGVKVVRWPKGEQAGAGGPEAQAGKGEEKQGKEEKQGEKDKRLTEYEKEKTVITADEVQYYYREKRVLAKGKVKAEQEKRTAWADEATYTDADEILVVKGNVRIQTAQGETFQCSKATISLRENWIEAEGSISSRFRVSEEE